MISALLLAALLGAPVESQDVLLVERFTGPGAKRAQAQVTRVLAQAPTCRVATAPGPEVTARLVGRIERAKRQVVLQLTVYRAHDGAELGAVRLAARSTAGLDKVIRARLNPELAPLLARAKPPLPPPPVLAVAPPPSPPPPAAPPARVEVPAPTPTSDEPRGGLLRLEAGVGFLNRQLYYTDDLFRAQQNYVLPFAPGARLGLVAHPGVLFGPGLVEHFGLYAQALLHAPLESEDAAGQRFDTRSLQVAGGLEATLDLGPLSAAATLGVGHQRYTVAGVEGGDAGVPEVRYLHLDAGARLRLELGPVAVRGQGAYLHLLGVGALDDADWFPRAQGRGVEVAGALEWAPWPVLAVVAGVDVRRYFFTMRPEVGDARVAGGAVDQYLVTHVGAQLRL
ncbi:MAG: hypothetical protein H6730_33050 [Deltaproteobacteria bacterium]|nr:hypothetical protein [Deltaproteobacteria bacterium]